VQTFLNGFLGLAFVKLVAMLSVPDSDCVKVYQVMTLSGTSMIISPLFF
jgi:hypothetical protein